MQQHRHPLFLIQKILQKLYCIYAMLLFVVLMVPVFLIAAIATLWGSQKGGNFIYRTCTAWADVWFFLIGIRHTNIYEHPPQKGKSYIYVANHISYLDAALLVKAVRTPVRPLGKVEMTRIPLFGFIYRNVIVTVDRSDAQKRARSMIILKKVLASGISVLFFPEGTFNTTDAPLKNFYDGAFRIAIETGTPIKPFLFLDTYDRMHYSSAFTLNPGRSRALFLEEVSVDGYTMEDVALLRQKVYSMMEQKLLACNASWIKDTAGTTDVA